MKTFAALAITAMILVSSAKAQQAPLPGQNVYQIRSVIGDSLNQITDVTTPSGRSRTFNANTPGFDTGHRPVWDKESLAMVLASDERRQHDFYEADLLKNRDLQIQYGLANTDHRSHHVNENHTTVNGQIRHSHDHNVSGTVNVRQTGRVCGTYNCHCAGRPARTVYYTGNRYYYDCPHRGRVWSGTSAWNWGLFTPRYSSLPYVPSYVYTRYSGLPLSTWSGPARIVTSYRGP